MGDWPTGWPKGGCALKPISAKIRQSVHRLAKRYHDYSRCESYREQFQQYCAERGLNIPWSSFRRAHALIHCNPYEFFLFKFYEKSPAEQDAYLTIWRRNCFARKIGDDQSANGTAPGNKILFNLILKDFLCREWLNLTACTAEEFAAFVKKHGTVMIKPACDGCGRGIRLYSYAGDEDAFARHEALAGEAMLAEEMPAQHEWLNRLNPTCLNTVRVCTYADRDDVHILLASLRTAKDDSFVDNFSAGGIFLAVDLETGAVISDGVDKKGNILSRHPHTGVPFRGFKLPNWDKALRTVRLAARRMYQLPQCRFLGWDVAFLANDEIALIECNWRQAIEIQLPHQRGIFHELQALGQKL